LLHYPFDVGGEQTNGLGGTKVLIEIQPI